MSDSLGGKFALTVPYVSYRDGAVEFAQMRGIEGVYLVNQKLTEGWDDERVATQISRDKGATWQPIDISRVTDVDGSPLVCFVCVCWKWFSLKKKLFIVLYSRVIIQWHQAVSKVCDTNWISIVDNDSHVSPTHTHTGCYLNLGLQSKLSHDTQYARGLFHSDDDAAGYAIAVGNVGPWWVPFAASFIVWLSRFVFVRFDPPFSRDEVQHATFLTTDAGWSWKRIRNGSHIAEFADQVSWLNFFNCLKFIFIFGEQGELIVLADDVTATKTLQWSGDGGKTWQECQVSSVEKTVFEIIIIIVVLDNVSLQTKSCWWAT